jgi:hypothetical protein
MTRADRVHSTPPLNASKIHPDDEIERRLLALIETHMAEPAPAVLWLTDRIASHAIVTRLRLVPARNLLLGRGA